MPCFRDIFANSICHCRNTDEADPTNRFGIGESFLTNKDETCETTSTTNQSDATGNTTPVDVPENVFDEPPPPPPPLPILMPPHPSKTLQRKSWPTIINSYFYSFFAIKVTI